MDGYAMKVYCEDCEYYEHGHCKELSNMYFVDTYEKVEVKYHTMPCVRNAENKCDGYQGPYMVELPIIKGERATPLLDCVIFVLVMALIIGGFIWGS